MGGKDGLESNEGKMAEWQYEKTNAAAGNGRSGDGL